MKILNITVQSDYEFPLSEAARKQCLYETLLKNTDNNKSDLWVITPDSRKKIEYKNIKILLIKKIDLFSKLKELEDYDEINFIGNIGIYSLIIGLFSKKSKTLTLTDGGIYSDTKKRFLIKLFTMFFHRYYDYFYVYTKYQKKLLIECNKRYVNKIKLIKPIIVDVDKIKDKQTRTKFTVLYMGYLSKSKGSDVLVSCIDTLIEKYSDIIFKIALSGQKNDKKILSELYDLKNKYKNNIIIEGKVDPFEELASANIYFYCFNRHSGTFAFPMSLYECLQAGTHMIGPNLEGVREFFDVELLSSCDKSAIIKIIQSVYHGEKHFNDILRENLSNLDTKVRKIDFI